MTSWVAAAFGIAATSALGAPGWGPVTEIPLTDQGDVVRVVTDAQGVPKIVRARVPQLGLQESPAMNARGDLVTLRDPEDGGPLQFVFVPLGGEAEITPIADSANATANFFGIVGRSALDEVGNVVALWQSSGPAMATVRTPSGRVVTTRLSESDADSSGLYVGQLADGDFMALWVEEVGGHQEIRSAVFDTVTSAWSTPSTVRIAPIGRDVRPIAATVDPDGSYLVVWAESPVDERSSNEGIRTARRQDGVSEWIVDPNLLVPKVGNYAGGVSPNGTLALAYTPDDFGQRAVQVLTRVPRGPWLPRDAIASQRDVFSFSVAVADTGAAAIATRGGSRRGINRPSSNETVVSTIEAAVAAPGQLFGPLTPLDRPRLGAVLGNAIRVGPDGAAIVRWQISSDPARPGRSFHAEFREGLTRPVRTFARIVGVATGPPTSAGAITWLRVRLSQPVEDATISVTAAADRRPLTTWPVIGKTVYVPVRGRRGRTTYRLTLNDEGAASRSSPVRVTFIRSPDQLLPTRLDAQIAGADRLLWIVEPTDRGDQATVRAIDAQTGRLRYRRQTIRQVSSVFNELLATPTRLWMLRDRDLQTIDVATGRLAKPIALPLAPRQFSLALAVRGERAWVVLESPSADSSSAPPRFDLMEVDGRTRRVVGTVGIRGLRTLLDPSDAAMITGNTLSIASVRINLRTGRAAETDSLWVADERNLWRLGPFAARRYSLPSVRIAASRVPQDRDFDDESDPNSFSVGRDGLWGVADPKRGDFNVLVRPQRIAVTRFANSTARPSTLRVGPNPHPSPSILTYSDPQIVAVRGGAWVSIPAYGVIVRVPSSRFPNR